MLFVNWPFCLRLCVTDPISTRNPHSAIKLVELQVASHSRERLSETLKINRAAVSTRITIDTHLTVDLNNSKRLNSPKTSYTPQRAEMTIIIIVVPIVDTM